MVLNYQEWSNQRNKYVKQIIMAESPYEKPTWYILSRSKINKI